MDFGEYDNCFTEQIKYNNLNREINKSFIGFSSVKFKEIETGHWGTGAFCGNKELKAIIQIYAAFLTENNLNYYCFKDFEFSQNFQNF